MDLKIKLLSPLMGEKVNIPFYASEGAAGMDLAACIDEDIVLGPMERVHIPCGFALQIPKGYAGFVYPRSGLATRLGVTLPNAVGVIDSDYRGELVCALINLSGEDYRVVQGERIAQLVISPIEVCSVLVCDDLDETKRGGGGFGSTGS